MATTIATAQAPTRPQRPRGEPRPGETKRLVRPVESPTEVIAPAKPEPAKPPDDGLLGDGREDDPVFLPDN